MAILSKDEILAKLKQQIGEDTSDSAIQFIEDVSDTYTDLETRSKDSTDWEKKYKENDDAWRKKYKERFFNAPASEEKQPDDDFIDDDELKNKRMSYDDLFKTN